jgi:hypothetical protein
LTKRLGVLLLAQWVKVIALIPEPFQLHLQDANTFFEMFFQIAHMTVTHPWTD